MLSLFHLTSTRDPEDNVMSSVNPSLIVHCFAAGPPEGFVGCETGDKNIFNALPSHSDGKIDISTVG